MIVIFDLDGTLLDTYQVIKATYIDVFNRDLPDYLYTEEEIKSFFGPPLIDTFMSITHNKEQSEKLCESYMEFSIPNHYKYLKSFPNSKEALTILKNKGYKLAIVSNKIREHIDLGLKITGMSEFFDFIVGLDEVENPKPHPEGVEKIKKHLGDDDCILVGDTAFDMVTANNANIIGVGVTWANTSKEELIANGAKYTIDDFLEIINVMEDINV